MMICNGVRTQITHFRFLPISPLIFAPVQKFALDYLRDQQILTPPCEWGWVVVVPLLGTTLEVEDSPGMVWYSIISFTIQIIFLFNRFHIHSYVVSGRLKGQIFFLSALIYPIDFFLKLHYIFSCLWKFRLIFPIFNYLNNLCFTKYKTCFIPSIDFSIVSVNQFISSLGWVVVFLGGGTVITRPVPTSKMGWIQNLCHALCDA